MLACPKFKLKKNKNSLHICSNKNKQTMQGINRINSKVSNWCEKAKKRGKEICALKKQMQEVVLSRNKWKDKCMCEKAENWQLRKALKELTKLRFKEHNEEGKEIKGEEKPKHHSYSAKIIMLCILLRQRGNCSLRSAASALKIVSLVLGLDLSFPSRGSIQNWEKKLGLYRLQSEGKLEEEWALIVDESISVGAQKLLLILGVELTKYKMDSALTFQEVSVLYIGIGKSWKGPAISAEIEKIKARKFSVSYAISDGGTNIGKALKISEITHVKDCTHTIGNLLKKQYNTSELFLEYSKKCGVLKRQVMLSKDAVIMPPKQRTKGRFLNLQPLSEWGYKMLLLLNKEGDGEGEGLTLEQKEKLQWLQDYEVLILEIYEQCKVMNELFKVLKNEGLTKQSVLDCNAILDKSNVVVFFKKGVRKYMDTQLKLAVNDKALICCSDIIESYFGKYKSQLAQTSSQVMTDSCLCIANFSQNFNEEEIKKAMEVIQIMDLKEWKQEKLPTSIIQQKRKLLKSVG